MRRLIITAATLALLGCRTNKEATHDASISESRRTSTLDSISTRTSMRFDTIYVELERPVESIRIKAVRAHVDRLAGQRKSVETSTDSTAVVSEKSASTGPPKRRSPISALLTSGACILCCIFGIWLGRKSKRV